MKRMPLPKSNWLVSPWLVWALMWLVVSVMLAAGNCHSLTTVYHKAALAWVRGDNMYLDSGHGFLYFPHAAIMFVPFAVVPEPHGELIWRAVGLAVFAFAVFRVARLVDGHGVRVHGRVAAISMILCANSLRVGQSTLLMTGLMLLAIDALERQRWNTATVWLSLGLAVKPLVVVLVLLVAAMHARMRWRMLVAAVALVLLPFAFQKPHYVLWQYSECSEMMRVAADIGNQRHWAHLFGMLKVFGLAVPAIWQTTIRLVAALATLTACWLVFKRVRGRRAFVWLYTLCAVYLMLFSPRTENSTYCILGPAIGMFFAEEAVVLGRAWRAWILLSLAIAAAGSYELGKFLTAEGARPIWLAPLACCGFIVYLGVRYRHDVIASVSDQQLAFAEQEEGTFRRAA